MKKSKNFERGGAHPLIYHPFIIKMIPEDLSGKVFLDVGCGKGIYGYLIRATKNSQNATLIGAEGENNLIDFLQKSNVYDKVIKTVLPDLSIKWADIVLCSEVIEHLPKNSGNKLLDEIDKICKGISIVTTPNIMFQPAGDGKFDRHVSLWTIGDFKRRGYKVYGLGVRLMPPSDKTNRFLQQIYYGLEYFITPFSWLFPHIGGYILAVKYFR